MSTARGAAPPEQVPRRMTGLPGGTGPTGRDGDRPDGDRPDGDRPAADGVTFDEFFVRHQHDLARLAYLVVGEHGAADDVAADALLAVWRQWDRVCEADHPLAYVRRMVINIATSRVRSSIRERHKLLAVVRRAGDRTEPNDSDPDSVVDIQAALEALPSGRRACVILRYGFDLSAADVAATLQISVGTVKSQTSKAAAQLRAALRPVTDLADQEHR